MKQNCFNYLTENPKNTYRTVLNKFEQGNLFPEAKNAQEKCSKINNQTKTVKKLALINQLKKLTR